MTALEVIIDDQTYEVPTGISIVAALVLVGNGVARHSASGRLRAPFRGTGVCQECRVTVDGHRVLTCQTEYQPEMATERSRHTKYWL